MEFLFTDLLFNIIGRVFLCMKLPGKRKRSIFLQKEFENSYTQAGVYYLTKGMGIVWALLLLLILVGLLLIVALSVCRSAN